MLTKANVIEFEHSCQDISHLMFGFLQCSFAVSVETHLDSDKRTFSAACLPGQTLAMAKELLGNCSFAGCAGPEILRHCRFMHASSSSRSSWSSWLPD